MKRRKPKGPKLTSDTTVALSRITSWAGRRGYEVKFTDQISIVYDSPKLVYISNTVGPAAQVYQFLHECGHILQGSDYSTRPGGPPKSSDASRFKEIAEEYDAWVRGWKLAGRLRLDISHMAYWRHASVCLYTYGDWALRPRDGRRGNNTKVKL